jgi:hypothetical protein
MPGEAFGGQRVEGGAAAVAAIGVVVVAPVEHTVLVGKGAARLQVVLQEVEEARPKGRSAGVAAGPRRPTGLGPAA